MEEGQDVQGREDGGHGGTLRGAVVEDHFREGFAIEGQGDLLVCEKRLDPVAQGGSKPKK